jgi:hypothetical protein
MMLPYSHKCQPENVAPEYALTQKGSAIAIERDATILSSQSFYDVALDSTSITSQATSAFSIDCEGTPAQIAWNNFTRRWEGRVFLTTETKRCIAQITFDNGHESEHSFYVASNTDVPFGQQISGVSAGQTLEANSNSVSVTLGAEPKPELSLLFVVIAIIRASDGQHVSSEQYSDDSQKGIALVTATNLPAGDYLIRTAWRYNLDPAHTDNVYEDVPFTVRSPDVAPWETSLTIYKTTLYTDDDLTGAVFTDSSGATSTRS